MTHIVECGVIPMRDHVRIFSRPCVLHSDPGDACRPGQPGAGGGGDPQEDIRHSQSGRRGRRLQRQEVEDWRARV